jgi:hypothetical protein
VAVVVALAVPVATLAALAPGVRWHAGDVRVHDAPLDKAPFAAREPVQRWVKPLRDEAVAGATVPVVRSRAGVEGLEPATGEVRWRVHHADREATGVEARNDRIVVTWTVYPTVRIGGAKHLRSLIDSSSGRVIAETGDEGEMFVDDRAVARPQRCEDAGPPSFGLLACETQVKRVDVAGRPLWTVDSVNGDVVDAVRTRWCWPRTVPGSWWWTRTAAVRR